MFESGRTKEKGEREQRKSFKVCVGNKNFESNEADEKVDGVRA